MKRFVAAPEGFEVNALQGAFVVKDGFVYAAETFGGKTSRSGRTHTPKLIEEGWIPGFRADQVPNPGDTLLEGRGEFVVFPVCNTGFDGNGVIIDKFKYTTAYNAWHYFRDTKDAKHGIYAFIEDAARKYEINEHTLRLARNATRQWPGSNPAGCTWTAREVLDLVEYHGATVVRDKTMGETHHIVYCESRAVIAMVNEFDSNSPVTVWGVCNPREAGDPELMLLEKYGEHPDLRPYLKVWTWDEETNTHGWEFEPVEDWLMTHGTPYQPDLVEKSKAAYAAWCAYATSRTSRN